jgi:hypothetical protein
MRKIPIILCKAWLRRRLFARADALRQPIDAAIVEGAFASGRRKPSTKRLNHG